MRIEITTTKVLFFAGADMLGCEVVKRTLADKSDTPVAAKANEGDIHDGEALIASFSLLDFNAITQTLILQKDGVEHDFDPLLAHLRLDRKQMDSHYYVTVHLFGAGMKRLGNNELFYQVLCYLKVMPQNWQFYGGLITLAVFRVSEELEARKNYVDFLLSRHHGMLQAYVPVSDHSVRWLISSSYNLAVISLYLERYEAVETLLDASINKGALNRTFPLTYMNYSQSLLLAALIKFKAGKREEANHLFLECADFCSVALSELFSMRNKFLLQHEMDSRIILDVGYVAFKSAVILTGERFASDSKVADFKVEPSRVDRLDFAVVARRYERHMGKVPSILSDIAEEIVRMKN